MSKTKKTILIVVVTVLVLAATSAVAFAATNTSQIEDLFLAFRTAQAEKAVAEGAITQEEADEMLGKISERMAEDETDAVPPLQGKGGRGGMMGGKMGGNPLELYAEMTGIDADTLRETLQSDETTLFAYADEQGKLDELKAAMIDEANAQIDQAVEDGKMDADKAAEMKENAAEKIDGITADTEMPMGPGGPNGEGGPKCGGRMNGGRGHMGGCEDCAAQEA